MASEAAQLNPWLSRANTLACAALVVAIAYVLVRTVYLFLDDAAGSTAPAVYGTSSSAASFQSGAAGGRRVDASALSMIHLFGEEGARPAAQAAPQDVAAPKTRLSLELQGVFVSEDENKSTAMISEAPTDKLAPAFVHALASEPWADAVLKKWLSNPATPPHVKRAIEQGND